MKDRFECTCDTCRATCEYKPGWFKPEEIEKAAKYLKLSVKDFFDKYLGVDWWEGIDDIFVLAPVVVGEQPGSEYPGNPKGRCIFYNKDGLCDIHPVKPFECAEMNCNTDETHHKLVADSWRNHQDQIEELLGRKPEPEEYSGGFLGGLFG